MSFIYKALLLAFLGFISNKKSVDVQACCDPLIPISNFNATRVIYHIRLFFAWRPLLNVVCSFSLSVTGTYTQLIANKMCSIVWWKSSLSSMPASSNTQSAISSDSKCPGCILQHSRCFYILCTSSLCLCLRGNKLICCHFNLSLTLNSFLSLFYITKKK